MHKGSTSRDYMSVLLLQYVKVGLTQVKLHVSASRGL